MWIARRVALGVLMLFAISLFVFVATEILPGDAAQAILGQASTPERLAVLRDDLGLDQSAVSRYFDWLGGLLSGDFGISIAADVPVTELIGPDLMNTVILLAVTAGVALPLAIVLGTMAAIRSNGRPARMLEILSLIFMALPEFVTGMVLIVLFATTVLQVLPAVSLIPEGQTPLSDPRTLILPVATLVIAVLPYLFRLVRAALIDSLGSDYVHMARLKGLPETVVVRRHALPNALIPVVQGSALMLAYLLSGAIVVEVLFSYPGLGSLLASAVADRDLPVVQAVTIIFAAGIIFFNLVADIVTVYLTPRLRTATQQ